MTTQEPRSAAHRKADTLAKLAAKAADIWVASASVTDAGAAQAYLVPLSLAWVDERIVLALEDTSQTARNVSAAGKARLALGPTRDVVMIDAELEHSHPVGQVPARIAEAYAAQSDWDPREAGAGYLFLVFRPLRIQAWREVNELRDRTLMRGGAWLA
ncbi:MAG TPA: hypothetical protein VE442_07570 [Jatrophihabitans sp.]|jgi:hypothetical protein|nr:hypothetical protein [Jatrophihabitans sp.]